MPRLRLSTDPSLPPSGGSGGPGDGLAVGQIAGVLRRSWAWIAVPTLMAALGAGVFVQVVTPRYTGEAKVLLESRDPAFARTAAERTDQPQPIDEQAVASQVQVAMSRDLAREAIRSLKLVGNPEFDPEAEGTSAIRRTLMMLGLVSAPMERASEDRILDTYLDHLLVYPVGKSRILAVEFRSRDPELAARGANTVADLYLASLEAASVDTARYASTWLGNNIATLRARVAEAEAKVEAFRAKHGLIGTGSSAAAQPLSSQQLSELSSQLSQARTIQADLNARAKLLKDMIKEGRAFEIPDVANNELIRRTVESRMAMRAQLALESRTLLPAHPRIKELTAQVQDLENQIKAAAERVVRTLENDAKIAGARVESLRAAVEGQQDVVAKGNSSEVELRALEREAKSQREQLESYLARYREAAARDAENASPANARVVSRAVVPDLPSPQEDPDHRVRDGAGLPAGERGGRRPPPPRCAARAGRGPHWGRGRARPRRRDGRSCARFLPRARAAVPPPSRLRACLWRRLSSLRDRALRPGARLRQLPAGDGDGAAPGLRQHGADRSGEREPGGCRESGQERAHRPREIRGLLDRSGRIDRPIGGRCGPAAIRGTAEGRLRARGRVPTCRREARSRLGTRPRARSASSDAPGRCQW